MLSATKIVGIYGSSGTWGRPPGLAGHHHGVEDAPWRKTDESDFDDWAD